MKVACCIAALSATKIDDRAELVRLVIPELLQNDVLHHYHTSLEGGIKGWDVRTTGYGHTFSGEGCSEAYRITLDSVSTVKQGKDVRS